MSEATRSTSSGIGLGRTARKGRVVIALRSFASEEIVEASPIIPFPADQGLAFEGTVLEPLPYRWTRERRLSGRGESPSNHWSLEGREAGALLLGYGSFINHSFRTMGYPWAIGWVLAAWGLGSAIGALLYGALHRPIPV